MRPAAPKGVGDTVYSRPCRSSRHHEPLPAPGRPAPTRVGQPGTGRLPHWPEEQYPQLFSHSAARARRLRQDRASAREGLLLGGKWQRRRSGHDRALWARAAAFSASSKTSPLELWSSGAPACFPGHNGCYNWSVILGSVNDHFETHHRPGSAPGITLAYHGDFDWAGIGIANLVMKEHKAGGLFPGRC